MNCQHLRQIGDNYGMSCQDCGEQLAGYGHWGTHKTCIHFFVKSGEETKSCLYCEMPEPPRATPADIDRIWKELWGDLTPEQVRAITDAESD